MKKRINLEIKVMYKDTVVATLISLQKGLDIPIFFSADGYQASIFEYCAKVEKYEDDLISFDSHEVFQMTNEEYQALVKENKKLAAAVLLYNLCESVSIGKCKPAILSKSKVASLVKTNHPYSKEILDYTSDEIDNLLISLTDKDIKTSGIYATYSIILDLESRSLGFKGFYHKINYYKEVDELIDGEISFETYVKYRWPHDVLRLDEPIDESNIEALYKGFNKKQIEALKDRVEYLKKKPNIKEVNRFCDYELSNEINIVSNSFTFYTAMLPLNYFTYFTNDEFEEYVNPFINDSTDDIEENTNNNEPSIDTNNDVESFIDSWAYRHPDEINSVRGLIDSNSMFDAEVKPDSITIITLEGKNSYMTRIMLDNKKPKSLICTCDEFNQDNCCKHICGLWYLEKNGLIYKYSSQKLSIFTRIKNIFKK